MALFKGLFSQGSRNSAIANSSILSQQVRWQQPMVMRHGIDQTRLIIEDAPTAAEPFSFVVMGDTDAGDEINGALANGSSTFAEGFAQQLLAQVKESQFLLHTGDVTYPTGTYQNYFNGFLKPYRSLLSQLPASPAYRGDAVVFNKPLLPVPGNHDYANEKSQAWPRVMRAVCDYLRSTLGIDLGHYGGAGGEAYGAAFLDNLASLEAEQLKAHLARHYSKSAENKTGARTGDRAEEKRGLRYKVGDFTRLPNRYYTFRCGGVDFFALDSNTWTTSSEAPGFDHEQLDWLARSLVQSLQAPGTVGRVIYLHHSPYTTEVSRWQKSETLWVRKHLRSVLARVRQRLPHPLASQLHGQRLVDLVISGHAHCLEHLQTTSEQSTSGQSTSGQSTSKQIIGEQTAGSTSGEAQGDAAMDWVVCGGSGVSVRPQWRSQNAEILENVLQQGLSYPKIVAKSRLYVGRHIKHDQKKSLYSFIRVEVRPNQACKFVVIPYVVSRGKTGWRTQQLAILKTYS